jgi:hypothetical protein
MVVHWLVSVPASRNNLISDRSHSASGPGMRHWRISSADTPLSSNADVSAEQHRVSPSDVGCRRIRHRESHLSRT